MMNFNRANGGETGFPDSAASNKEKDSLEYGAAVARAIEHEWFSKEGDSTRYNNNKQKFHSLRLYAQGDQDVRKYKDEVSFNGDLSYLNLDWKPEPIIPKFVDVVVNGMRERDISIRAEAVDNTSMVERKRYTDRLKAEMEHQAALQEIQNLTGVSPFENNPRKLPRSKEEMDIYLELEYKQSSEVAIETAIDFELKKNRFESIRERINYDLVTIGMGAVKHGFSPNEGVTIDYVDPASLVYSDTKSKYFDDCDYVGEIKRVSLSSLQKSFPHLTSDQVKQLSQLGGSHYDHQNTDYNRETQDGMMIDLIYITFKTTHNEIYKMKETPTGGFKAIARDESFLPPKDKRTGFKRTHRANEVIYEGIKILGADIMLKWEMQKNMVRPSSTSAKVCLPYVIASPKQYRGKLYSLVDRIQKYADDAQLISLKIQQAIQRMTPSGVYLDADGLVELDLGNGSSYSPQEALNMYFQTGSVIGRSMTDDAGFNHGRIPIQELPGSSGAGLQALIGAYQFQLEKIRMVTGVNEARDGSQPDKDALVGTQKLAVENSNVATRHMDDASEYIIEVLSDGVCSRIKDLLSYSPLKKEYINAVGKMNVNVLDDLKDANKSDFGIFLELGPTQEENLALESNIQQALAQQSINIEDAIDVRTIKNIKTANALLKIRRKQKEALDMHKQKQAIEHQNNGLAMVAQKTEAAKGQTAQIESQAKAKQAQIESQLKLREMQEDVKAKKELMFYEFELGLQTLQATKNADAGIAARKNEADLKKEGMKQSAQGQAELPKPAKIFESKGNDTLGQTGIGNFEPK